MIIDEPAEKKTGHRADPDNPCDYADRSPGSVSGGRSHFVKVKKHSFTAFAIKEEVPPQDRSASHDPAAAPNK
jgi:hypothetical protein